MSDLSLITKYRGGAQEKTKVLSGICLPIPQRPGLREGLWQGAKRERPVNSGDSVGIPGVTHSLTRDPRDLRAFPMSTVARRW